MPVVPEKLSSRHGSRSAISSQFWESAEHSTRYIDGQAWELPCEPPALNLTGSSGLSRSQQLIAARSIGIPFVPSYDNNSGGLVLDRVLAKFGGLAWWSAISGRVKAQRMYNSATSGGRKVQALQDLESYALCARTRVQLSRCLAFNGVIEAPSARLLRGALAPFAAPFEGIRSDSIRAGTAMVASPSPSPVSATNSDQSASAPLPSIDNAIAAHATLRATLPGHDVTASVGRNMDYVESSGDYARVPVSVAIDLTSHDRIDGLQYRVGLHQITAPQTEAVHMGARGRSSLTPSLRAVLHAQGAVAVEGEAYIWRSNSANGGGSGANGDAAAKGKDNHGGIGGSSDSAAGQQQKGMSSNDASVHMTGYSARESGVHVQEHHLQDSNASSNASTPSTVGTNSPSLSAPASMRWQSTDSRSSEPVLLSNNKLSKALAKAAAADSGDVVQKEEVSSYTIGSVPGRKNPSVGSSATSDDGRLDDGEEGVEGGHGTVSSTSKDTPASASADIGVDTSSVTSSSIEAFLNPLTEHLSVRAVARPEKKKETATTILLPEQPLSNKLIPVTSETVTAAIQDSLALLQQLKSTVSQVTSDVQDGSLQRLSEQLSRKQEHRRRPYSMLLAQPHLKINAAMGCLARMPLPPLRAFTLGVIQDDGGTGGVASHIPGSLREQHQSSVVHRRNASTSSLASKASMSSQMIEAWEPYLKGTALRVFASTGISGQLGKFTRPFLDYTAASFRVDVGLTSPHVVGSIPNISTAATSTLNEADRPDKHRAFALEGRGSWHALSVSLAQQVIGPVRARADFRFALDPTNVPQDQGERSTLKGLTQTALSVRPSLLEAVYGADVVLPGTEGAASVVNVKVIVYVVLKGEMAKETKVQKGKRSNATSKDGPIRGRKGGVTEKKVSVGKKIRDVKRLLSKPDLDEAIRRSQEKRLADLLKEAEERKKQDRERKLAIKYHKVRFFERVKLERRIKKIKADFKDGGAISPTDTSLLQQLEDDLQYVLHFPKGERYVSVLINCDDPAAQAHIVAERARLRGLVKKHLAEEALLAEADEGKSLFKGTLLGDGSQNNDDDKYDALREKKVSKHEKVYPDRGVQISDDDAEDDDFFLNDDDDQRDGLEQEHHRIGDDDDELDDDDDDDDDELDDNALPLQKSIGFEIKKKHPAVNSTPGRQLQTRRKENSHHHEKKSAAKNVQMRGVNKFSKMPRAATTTTIKKPSTTKKKAVHKKAAVKSKEEKQPVRMRAEGGRKRRGKKKE